MTNPITMSIDPAAYPFLDRYEAISALPEPPICTSENPFPELPQINTFSPRFRSTLWQGLPVTEAAIGLILLPALLDNLRAFRETLNITYYPPDQYPPEPLLSPLTRPLGEIISILQPIELETNSQKIAAALADSATIMEQFVNDPYEGEAAQRWLMTLREQGILWKYAELVGRHWRLPRDLPARAKVELAAVALPYWTREYRQSANSESLRLADAAAHTILDAVNDLATEPAWIRAALAHRLRPFVLQGEERLTFLTRLETRLLARPDHAQEPCKALLSEVARAKDRASPARPLSSEIRVTLPLPQEAERAILTLVAPEDIQKLQGSDGRITRTAIDAWIPSQQRPTLLSAWTRWRTRNQGPIDPGIEAVALVKLAIGFEQSGGTDFHSQSMDATFRAVLDSARQAVEPFSSPTSPARAGHDGFRDRPDPVSEKSPPRSR